jgi:predicted nucleic acid-binding protein
MGSRAAWAMTTAIDTNVIVALWDRDPGLSSAAQSALDVALGRGTLVTTATVFAELIAAPGRSESFLDSFFRETGINIDWALEESVWRTAGRAFQGYAGRRRKQRDAGPRRILADFLIGAHALEGGHSLLTLDDHLYRTAFPHLTVVRV